LGLRTQLGWNRLTRMCGKLDPFQNISSLFGPRLLFNACHDQLFMYLLDCRGRHWKGGHILFSKTVFCSLFSAALSRLNIVPGKAHWRGKLSTADLLIKVACFQAKCKWYFHLKRQLIWTSWYKEVNCTQPSPTTRRSTVLSLPLLQGGQLYWAFPYYKEVNCTQPSPTTRRSTVLSLPILQGRQLYWAFPCYKEVNCT
jgi:hypothetical protein